MISAVAFLLLAKWLRWKFLQMHCINFLFLYRKPIDRRLVLINCCMVQKRNFYSTDGVIHPYPSTVSVSLWRKLKRQNCPSCHFAVIQEGEPLYPPMFSKIHSLPASEGAHLRSITDFFLHVLSFSCKVLSLVSHNNYTTLTQCVPFIPKHPISAITHLKTTCQNCSCNCCITQGVKRDPVLF